MAAPRQDAKVRIRQPERKQFVIQMECADQLVPPEHRVRLIWAVVTRLDLSAFEVGIRAREGEPGRDTTDPRLLVALWLYATLRNIGSARELARRCTDERPFRWLCGGVSVNYHLLSDFRVGFADALDDLFTQVLASLAQQRLVNLDRASQDGVRVRASAGEKTFRRQPTLEQSLVQARARVAALRTELDSPAEAGGQAARRQAARHRAARARVTRLERAVAAVQQMQAQQTQAAERLSARQRATQQRPPRVSPTDVDARRMRMSDGGYRPAYNVQLLTDVSSRALVALDVTNAGNDYEQSAPLRVQAERRLNQKLREHLYDGGFVTRAGIEAAERAGLRIYAPPKPPRNTAARAAGTAPRAGDSDAIAGWRARMATPEGKKIYGLRAATSETVNADLLQYRGLRQVTVRGLANVRCVVLWAALAYNLLHYGAALLT